MLLLQVKIASLYTRRDMLRFRIEAPNKISLFMHKYIKKRYNDREVLVYQDR